jgi:hypothetical protein
MRHRISTVTDPIRHHARTLLCHRTLTILPLLVPPTGVVEAIIRVAVVAVIILAVEAVEADRIPVAVAEDTRIAKRKGNSNKSARPVLATDGPFLFKPDAWALSHSRPFERLHNS